MNTHRMVAKAVNTEARSDAIVVSFGAEWYESLRAKRFTAVIRKRVPTSIKPRWLYFHMNSPKSAICARAEVVSVEMIDRERALQISRELNLPEEQIIKYFGSQEWMGCYRLGEIDFPERDMTHHQLAVHMVYHPPQSFFVLSKNGREVLDSLCGFGVVVEREASRK